MAESNDGSEGVILAMGRTASWDVIVIGGGPAGSATSTLLAMQGRQVLLLEKERFPRFRIGESFMPATWWSFEKLGITATDEEKMAMLQLVKAKSFEKKDLLTVDEFRAIVEQVLQKTPDLV